MKFRQIRKALDEKLEMSAPRRETLESLAVECASDPSPNNTFQYAFCLAKSSQENELKYAIKILDSLVKEGYEHQLDCMYGAATALYLLGKYKQARIRCENILRSHPDHTGAKELHIACIDGAEQEKERQATKIAAIGTTAVAVAGFVAMALKKR